ncbi:uncharacterized protein [Nicotiana sylvestris]|uniref:uncharacterized protein n=1 Tax=Nicotiana sylvestris TaxID=4096 RepID=UPI00388C52C0
MLILRHLRLLALEKRFLSCRRLHFPSKAFDKLKFELLRCEARLRKALDREKSLRLLCDERGKELRHLRYESKTEDLEHLWGEVGQAKHECNDLRAQIDVHVAAKKNALAKVSSLEVQLRNARENSSIQTSRIARLECDLLEMKADVVEAQTKAEEIQAKAERKVVVYLKDDVEVRAKLRDASDRESRSNDYAWCKSRRETLKKIHPMGFDLSEEIAQARTNEYDAKFLLFDAEDSGEEADGATVTEGKIDWAFSI